MIQLELTIPDGIRHLATGVIYPPGLSLEQLIDHRKFCARAHASSLHWLTDNSREILKNYGDEALQKAADLVSLENDQARAEQALLKLEVAPLDCLPPCYYVVLGNSGLDAAKQGEWVETTLRERLTPHELKRSIKEGEVWREGQNHVGVPTPHAVRQQFDFWRRAIGETWREWPPEVRAIAISELAPIAEFVREMNDVDPTDGSRPHRAYNKGKEK
jgi:hypothetical protein